MARSYETALAELENARVELEALNMIGEEEACYIYNVDRVLEPLETIYDVDSKSEIVKIISEDIEALEREVEYLTPKIYEPEYDY